MYIKTVRYKACLHLYRTGFFGDGIKHIARTVFCVLLLCIEGEQAHAPGIELFNVGDFVAVIVGIADQRSAVI